MNDDTLPADVNFRYSVHGLTKKPITRQRIYRQDKNTRAFNFDYETRQPTLVLYDLRF